MSFVVFLDVDGVLNTTTSCVVAPSGLYKGVDYMRIELLAAAMKKSYNANQVVLTTTWKDLREDDEDYLYLKDNLLKYGINIIGKTKDEMLDGREIGIMNYLKEHPEIDEFIILDDYPYGFKDYRKLWESFIDTQGKGIEHAECASKTPSIPAILFLDAIKELEKQ